MYIFEPPFTNIPDFNTKLFDVQNSEILKIIKLW